MMGSSTDKPFKPRVAKCNEIFKTDYNVNKENSVYLPSTVIKSMSRFFKQFNNFMIENGIDRQFNDITTNTNLNSSYEDILNSYQEDKKYVHKSHIIMTEMTPEEIKILQAISYDTFIEKCYPYFKVTLKQAHSKDSQKPQPFPYINVNVLDKNSKKYIHPMLLYITKCKPFYNFDYDIEKLSFTPNITFDNKQMTIEGREAMLALEYLEDLYRISFFLFSKTMLSTANITGVKKLPLPDVTGRDNVLFKYVNDSDSFKDYKDTESLKISFKLYAYENTEDSTLFKYRESLTSNKLETLEINKSNVSSLKGKITKNTDIDAILNISTIVKSTSEPKYYWSKYLTLVKFIMNSTEEKAENELTDIFNELDGINPSDDVKSPLPDTYEINSNKSDSDKDSDKDDI